MRTHYPSRGKSETGFTLAELLVSIVILVVLSALSIPYFANQKEKAADAADKYLLSNIVNTYRTAKGAHGTAQLTSENILVGDPQGAGVIKMSVEKGLLYSNLVIIDVPTSGAVDISMTQDFCVEAGGWRQLPRENEPVKGTCDYTPEDNDGVLAGAGDNDPNVISGVLAATVANTPITLPPADPTPAPTESPEVGEPVVVPVTEPEEELLPPVVEPTVTGTLTATLSNVDTDANTADLTGTLTAPNSTEVIATIEGTIIQTTSDTGTGLVTATLTSTSDDVQSGTINGVLTGSSPGTITTTFTGPPQSETPTPTASETTTPTPTPTASETTTPTPTPTASDTPTPTPTPTASDTPTPTPTSTSNNNGNNGNGHTTTTDGGTWGWCFTVPSGFRVFHNNFGGPWTGDAKNFQFASLDRINVDEGVLQIRNGHNYTVDVSLEGGTPYETFVVPNVAPYEEVDIVVPWAWATDKWYLYEMVTTNDVTTKTLRKVKVIGSNPVSKNVIPPTTIDRCQK